MFAPPSLTMVKLRLSVAADKDVLIMLLDATCAFLFGIMKRSMHIDPTRQDPRYGGGGAMGKLRMALYGARDAPHVSVARSKPIQMAWTPVPVRCTFGCAGRRRMGSQSWFT